MSDYQQVLIDNFMLIGIKPNTLWRNLLTNNLKHYHPETLFSFPESEEEQRGLISCICPRTLEVAISPPTETQIERYMITNHMGEIFYAYWKIIYEETSEEDLYSKYEIKNIKKLKGTFGSPDSTDQYLARMTYVKKGKDRIYKLRECIDKDPSFNMLMPHRKGSEEPNNIIGIEEEKGITGDRIKKQRKSKLSQQTFTPGTHIQEKGLLPIPETEHESMGIQLNNGQTMNDIDYKTGKKNRSGKGVHKFLMEMECADDMNMMGTAYKKVTSKARRKMTEDFDLGGGGDPEQEDQKSEKGEERDGSCEKEDRLNGSNEDSHKIFVPIAICVKTRNPSNEAAELILESLIASLYSTEGNYFTEIQNRIYAFAEFSSHLLSLTHVISPPPLSELTLTINSQDIIYSEGKISGLPNENDISVFHLCSMISTDDIITLWTAMLLDLRIIVYTSQPNNFFFIAKALSQLIFPFSYVYSKGVIPSLELLLTPTPYCFGILKSSYPNKNVILEKLAEDSVNYVIIDVEGKQLEMFPKNTIMTYPNFYKLKTEVDILLKRHSMERKSLLLSASNILGRPDPKMLEISSSIRNLFYNETMSMLPGFDIITKKEKTGIYDTFRTKFLKYIYEKEGKKLSTEMKAFLEALSFSQCFAFLFDEVWNDQQGNFSRVQAMRKAPSSSEVSEILKISLYSSPAVVLERMKKLIMLAEKYSSSNKEQDSQLKRSFDWQKEFNKMIYSKSMLDRAGEFRLSKIKTLSERRSKERGSGASQSMLSEGSPFLKNLNKYKDCLPSTEATLDVDIVLNWEEMKETSLPRNLSLIQTAYQSHFSNKKKASFHKAFRQKDLFYGPQGFIAFLNKHLSLSKAAQKELHLKHEVRKQLEHLRNTITKSNSSLQSMEKSAPNSGKCSDKMENSDDEDTGRRRSEGNVALKEDFALFRQSSSQLVDSLVDFRDFETNRKTQSEAAPPFIFFNMTSCFQFYLFMAFYYSQYDYSPEEICSAYYEAYRHLTGNPNYICYFPIWEYKAAIKDLSLESLRDLLYRGGELLTVIKDVYELKLIEADNMIRKSVCSPLSRGSSEHTPVKFERSQTIAMPASAPMNQTDFLISPKLAMDSPIIAQSQTPVAKQQAALATASFLNNFGKISKTKSSNPSIILACALNDLLQMLKALKYKGALMFQAASKAPMFEVIEKQAAALRTPNFFAISKDKDAIGANSYLSDEGIALSFFINLYNFMMLFALCKTTAKKLPHNADSWVQFAKAAVFKVSQYTLSAYEIEHGILRNAMPSKESQFRFAADDPRRTLAQTKPNPLISFALYIPIKTSVSLRVFRPDTVLQQLELEVMLFFKRTIKFNVSKRQITCPFLLSRFQEDLKSENNKTGKKEEDMMYFIGDHLPGDVIGKFREMYTNGGTGKKAKQVSYSFDKEKYDFAYDDSAELVQ